MKVLDRYIMHRALAPFVYCLGVFLLLMIFADLFENLDMILKNKVPLSLLIQYYGLKVPEFAVQISSLAILLSSVYVLSRFVRFNEMVAMRACGINIFRVIFPFLFLGIIVSLGIIILNETVLPHFRSHFNVIKETYLEGKQEGVFHTNLAFVSYNYSYFIKKYDIEKKEMYGITILKSNAADEIVSRIDAKHGKWTGTGWRFFEGTFRNLDAGKGANLTRFNEKFIALPETPKNFAHLFSLNFMRYRELKKHINKMRQSGYVPKEEWIILYSKIALPFANFFVLLVGIPFIFMSSNMHVVTGCILSLVVNFAYKIIVVFSIALGNSSLISPLASAWMTNILFGIAGIWLLKKTYV